VLSRLEAGRAKTGGLAAGLDDLPLFAAITETPPPADPLRQALGEVDPDSLTARAALELIYRLKALAAEKAGDGWKIYDVNVGGFWLVDAYKGQFAKDLSAGGIDALITRLAEKNKSLATAKN
jgi:hypothetical protein